MTHIEEIIKDVVSYLSSIEDAKCIAFNDFTEDREPNMIVVGIDSCENVNFGLDDFRYEMTVLVDCFIDEDKDGKIFERIVEDVLDSLNKIFDDPERYGDIFPDLDRICLFHFANKAISVSERSNRASISIEIVGSFN